MASTLRRINRRDCNSITHKTTESLFVVNPVTNECVPLPEPQNSVIKELTNVAFATKLDQNTALVDKFMVVEYQPVSTNHAILLCFSSDVGKWVEKSANYILGSRLWRPEGSFEFEGQLFWLDVSIGLITWDLVGSDPFVGLENEEAGVCRFIPLPSGRAKPIYKNTLLGKRYVGCDGGFIQYMEVFKKENCVLKLWRLNDCQSGEWSLMYKVSRDYVEKNLPCGFEKGMPKPCFIHPFKADVAYFKTDDYMVSLNVRTQEVQSCVGFSGSIHVLSVVLPKWPSPIPKRLYAAYAKEEGNACFKSQNFGEAIKCYSKSIALSPNAVAFSNRAMSYLKVNKFQEAESDCTESLKLDPNYFKVYWRRALARKKLGYLKEALEDLEVGLKLEPENKELKKLIAEIKSSLDEMRLMQKNRATRVSTFKSRNFSEAISFHS